MVRTRRLSSEGGAMLLTVAHQNRSPTFRGGSTTVPVEQSAASSKLYSLCIFLNLSCTVFYSDEGSDTAADTLVFCIIKFLCQNSGIHSIVFVSSFINK